MAVSSYQGGHMEYFRYLVDRLRAEGRRRHPGLRRRRRGHRPLGDRGARGLRRAADLLAGRRAAPRARADGQPADRGVRPRPGRRPPAPARRAGRPATDRALARWITCIECGSSMRRRHRRPAGRPRARAHGAGARHHRHRRVGEVVPDRRAGPPVPAGPGGQALHRRAGRRPHPAPGRGCTPRRPHPHERHRRPQRLLPLAGHPRFGLRAARPLPRGGGGLRRGRVRPGHRRDPRHRPG